MSISDRDFCLRSMAYLKVALPINEKPHAVLSNEDNPVLTDLGHGLLTSYLVDQGSSFSYVQGRHLKASGLNQAELHSQAIANLTSRAELETKVRQHGNIYAAFMDGNFEASLLLVDEFWDEWYSALAPNGFIAAFPARDVLAFGDISSSQVISELQEVSNRAAGSVDHPLSTQLFRRIGSTWQPIGR